MASRFVLPFADVGSGIKPSSGAQLFFFKTGTSTPKDTFTDSTEATPNANPVIADANGLFPDIFISGAYKVVLEDKDDSQIWEADPVEEFVTGSGQSNNLLERATLSVAVNDSSLTAGLAIDIKERVLDNGGGGIWDVVLTSTVTPNTFNIVISIADATLSLVLRIGPILEASQWGIGMGEADDTTAMDHIWTTAARGTTIMYPGGLNQIPITNLLHPTKLLNHIGIGPSEGKSPDDVTGTAFRAIGAANSYMIEMPPPNISNPAESCRFALFKNFSVFGDGTLLGGDIDATNNFLKINNQGTNIEKVNFRWVRNGIEVNTNTGQSWKNIIGRVAGFGVVFRYETTTPFNALEFAFSTAGTYKDISISTGNTAGAIGWNIDATCQYGQNTLINVDLEVCFTGMRVEGRVSAKDTLLGGGALALGAAGFAAGNNHIGCWFEANTNDVIISYDSGQEQPLLAWNSLTRTAFTITGTKSDSWVQQHNSIQAIMPDALENGEGEIGALNNPITAQQFVVSGPNVTTINLKTIVDTKLPNQAGNRLAFNTNSSFEFDIFLPDVPLVGSTVNVANVVFGAAIQSAAMKSEFVGSGASGDQVITFGQYLVQNNSDAIAHVIVTEDSNDSPIPLKVQAIRSAANTFGIFVFKDAGVTEVISATLSMKVVIGGSSGGGNLATLNILI